MCDPDVVNFIKPQLSRVQNGTDDGTCLIWWLLKCYKRWSLEQVLAHRSHKCWLLSWLVLLKYVCAFKQPCCFPPLDSKFHAVPWGDCVCLVHCDAPSLAQGLAKSMQSTHVWWMELWASFYRWISRGPRRSRDLPKVTQPEEAPVFPFTVQHPNTYRGKTLRQKMLPWVMLSDQTSQESSWTWHMACPISYDLGLGFLLFVLTGAPK